MMEAWRTCAVSIGSLRIKTTATRQVQEEALQALFDMGFETWEDLVCADRRDFESLQQDVAKICLSILDAANAQCRANREGTVRNANVDKKKLCASSSERTAKAARTLS